MDWLRHQDQSSLRMHPDYFHLPILQHVLLVDDDWCKPLWAANYPEYLLRVYPWLQFPVVQDRSQHSHAVDDLQRHLPDHRFLCLLGFEGLLPMLRPRLLLLRHLQNKKEINLLIHRYICGFTLPNALQVQHNAHYCIRNYDVWLRYPAFVPSGRVWTLDLIFCWKDYAVLLVLETADVRLVTEPTGSEHDAGSSNIFLCFRLLDGELKSTLK